MRDGGTAADDNLAAPVEAMKAGKDTILWDSEFTGFGVRVQPTGLRSYLVNYRAGDRARSRAMPTLREAFEDYLAAGPRRGDSTITNYRRAVHKDLGDWLDRTLDTIDRRDVEQRFRQLTERPGWVQANSTMKLLGAIYRRPCLDFEDLRNPVEQWRAAGGRLHPPRRRRIQPPSEVLPR